MDLLLPNAPLPARSPVMALVQAAARSPVAIAVREVIEKLIKNAVEEMFSDGREGVFYDPANIDRYKKLGPELVKNGTFDSNIAGWTARVGTITWDATGTMTMGDPAAASRATGAGFPTVVGRRYEVSYTYVSGDITCRIRVATADHADPASAVVEDGYMSTAGGKARFIFVAQSTTTYLGLVTSGAGYVTVDDLSTREVTIDWSQINMWQDDMGTTPVLLPGESVALFLDTRQVLARGVELWQSANVVIKGESQDLGGGVYRVYSSIGDWSSAEMPSGTVELGKRYEVTFEITDVTAGSIKVGNVGPSYNTVGKHRCITDFDATNPFFKRLNGTETTDVTVANITLKEIPGHHAPIPTSTVRPTYQTDGTRHWLQLDGSDDVMTWAMPTAGTSWLASFAVQRNAGDAHSLFLSDAQASPNFVGAIRSGYTTYSPFGGAPHGDTFVNGAVANDSNRDTLYAAIPESTDLVVSFTGLDLTAWADTILFGAYNGYPLGCRLYGLVLTPHVAGDTTQDTVQGYLAEKAGILI